MNTSNETNSAKLVEKLMQMGISPRYRAFAYLIYLLNTLTQYEILRMSNADLLDHVATETGLSVKHIASNFKSLMINCEYVNGERNKIYTTLACLNKNDIPTLKEFVMAVQCILIDQQANEKQSTVLNSSPQ